ncbi:uncharacterized protein A4U43_C09F14580 [Asparagus officinalis]|uniref:Uncharacterized protein n=1 Tax=Asparagus officinalis TaxID=4686 RepID=A0A5P1EAN8_ASPOF|nr:uncharacterized protein A4U43_C09F14580 [Asparagus officinalis]
MWRRWDLGCRNSSQGAFRILPPIKLQQGIFAFEAGVGRSFDGGSFAKEIDVRGVLNLIKKLARKGSLMKEIRGRRTFGAKLGDESMIAATVGRLLEIRSRGSFATDHEAIASSSLSSLSLSSFVVVVFLVDVLVEGPL